MKIVSNGRGIDTTVYDDEGKAMPGITKIEIHPITGRSTVTAVLTFINVELEIGAEEYVECCVETCEQRGTVLLYSNPHTGDWYVCPRHRNINPQYVWGKENPANKRPTTLNTQVEETE